MELALTLEQVKALLSSREASRSSWLTHSEKRLLLIAIDADKDQVALTKGIFTIKYNGDSVFVKKNNCSVPCGSFNIKKLRMDVVEF